MDGNDLNAFFYDVNRHPKNFPQHSRIAIHIIGNIETLFKHQYRFLPTFFWVFIPSACHKSVQQKINRRSSKKPRYPQHLLHCFFPLQSYTILTNKKN